MSSVGPTALEAQPGASFEVGGGIACIFWHASPPFYLCDMRTSAFLGT